MDSITPKKVTSSEYDVTISIEGNGASEMTVDDMLEMFKGLMQSWGYHINGELVVEPYED